MKVNGKLNEYKNAFKKIQLNNFTKLVILLFTTIIMACSYLFIGVDFDIIEFSMKIRLPKFFGIVIAGTCIGFATIIFQTIVKNRIITPSILGMNSLYILITTLIVIILGIDSILIKDANISFILNIIIMCFASIAIYGFVFKVTNYNMLYVLLIGTVLTTLFTSISNTIIRVIDPNEFSVIETNLIASFDNINTELLIISSGLIVLSILAFWNDLRKLNVISLGKAHAINLGIEYDSCIKRLLILTTILISIATALVGPISFLGMVVVNLSRQVFRTYKHSYLVISSILLAVFILFLCQVFVEQVFNFTASISTFINIFGGIYFLYLIYRAKGL